MKKYILAILLATTTAFGFTEVDKQYKVLQNILSNPGFENGKTGWSDSSAATFSLTSGLYGNASGVWAGTTSGQALRSSAYTLSQGLYSKACLGSFSYKGGASTITGEVRNSSGSVLASQQLFASSVGTNVQMPFLCPTSGGVDIGIKANASNSSSIIVDNFYVGEDQTLGQVSQFQLIGSSVTDGACQYGKSVNASFGTLASGTCVPVNTGSLSMAASGTASWTLTSMPAGEYLISLGGSLTCTDSTTKDRAICDFRMTDGTLVSESATVGIIKSATANTYSYMPAAQFHMSVPTSGTRTISLQAMSSSGNNTESVGFIGTNSGLTGAGNGPRIYFYRIPTGNDVAFRPDNAPASWSGYHDSDCGGTGAAGEWRMNGTSYTDAGDDASCTFAEVQNRNFGSVSSLGAKKPGLSFTPPRVGRYLVTANFQLFGSVVGNYISARIIDNNSSEVGSSTCLVNNSLCGLTISGIINVSSLSSPTTVRIQAASIGGGNTGVGVTASTGITGARTISWSIVELDSPMTMPFIQNSVRSSYSGVTNLEWARVTGGTCSSSPCTLTDSSDGISSVTRTGAGAYQINFASGAFSTAPTCSVSSGTISSNLGVFGVGSSVNTTSAVNFTCELTDGIHSATDCGFTINCLGKR